MSKRANHWEASVGTLIPYLQWSELCDGAIHHWTIGRHNHATYELHIILSGQCSLFIHNTELILKAGQAVLIAPEIFHGPNSVTQPFCRFSVSFLPDEMQLSGINAFLLFSVDETIRDLCAQILEEIRKEDRPFHKELLANQFAQLMLRVFRTVRETAADSVTAHSHPGQLEDMTVIDDFFVNTPPNLRSKENLARLLHCSQRQVLRKIHALYGISFQKKQTLSRIDSAQHLLRVTDKSIEEICALVGYCDPAAFCKAFKLQTGTTPARYRKGAKK